MVSLEEYFEILQERPRKFTAKEVGYKPAPEGSAMRCAACLHYFRRAIDDFATCEIFRDEETDRKGVQPHWRCGFYTLDAQVHPLLEREEDSDELEESLQDA